METLSTVADGRARSRDGGKVFETSVATDPKAMAQICECAALADEPTR